MLSGMREAQKGWLGKIIMTVMFGFLILSFGIWGIGDIFRITHREVVASVGSREITTLNYRDAFQTELQRQSQQARRNLTTGEALALGLDRQLLQTMLADAALDQKAGQLGLALSDATIAQAVYSDPTFKNPDGTFNPARFGEALRQSGYTEQSFLHEQRGLYLRRQLVSGIAGAPPIPALMLDALHRFTAETRNIDYIVLAPASVGEIAAPDDAALTSFYDSHKAEFAAPEYRSLMLLPLDPEKLAKPESVSEADARAAYDKLKDTRFTTPEKRSLERIPFKDKAEAEAAEAKLKSGTSFDQLTSELGLSAEDLSIGAGSLTKSAIADKALAEAAFTQPQDVPSAVVETGFGPVILRVKSIEPAIVKPFEEVAQQLRQEIATERVKTSLRDLRDKIEDQRASAKPVADVATALNLPSVKIDAVDAAGRGRDGKLIEDIPDRDLVLKAAFQSEVGGDNDAVSLRNGGYVWFDVNKIDPAHDRPLAEVKNEVVQAWTADQRSILLARKAGDLVKRLEGGTPIADIAKEVGVEVNSVDDVTRQTTPPGLSPAAVNAVFSVKSDGAGYALGADGQSRIVFKVKSASLPSADPTATANLSPRLKFALEDDMAQAYVQRLERDLGVSIDQGAVQAALRGSDTQQ